MKLHKYPMKMEMRMNNIKFKLRKTSQKEKMINSIQVRIFTKEIKIKFMTTIQILRKLMKTPQKPLLMQLVWKMKRRNQKKAKENYNFSWMKTSDKNPVGINYWKLIRKLLIC